MPKYNWSLDVCNSYERDIQNLMSAYVIITDFNRVTQARECYG